MARRNDHSREELQDLILDSAAALIKEGGREVLTARNLSAKIGYVPGTLYNIYGSMEGLILHLDARTLDRLYETLAAVPHSKGQGQVVHNLLKMADAYRKFVEENKSSWLLLFDVRMPKDRTTISWYQAKVDRLFSLLENILAPAFKNGEDHKLHMAARILWSSFHGLCYLEEKGQFHTVGKNVTVSEMTKFLVERFMAGLAKN